MCALDEEIKQLLTFDFILLSKFQTFIEKMASKQNKLKLGFYYIRKSEE